MRNILIIILILILALTSSGYALDRYWEEKMTKGIERWVLRPILELKDVPQRAAEYNSFIKGLKKLPAWLEEPADFDEIREKLPSYQQELLSALKTLNQEKIPPLGIFNTTWARPLVSKVNLRDVENVLRTISASLEQARKEKEAGAYAERICRACIKKLKELLNDELSPFTSEFKTTFSYERGKEVLYQGNRLVAGFIQHFEDFNTFRFYARSQNPAYSLSFAGHREIKRDAKLWPDYSFVKESPPLVPQPVWQALGFPPYPQGLRFIGYYYLRGFTRQEEEGRELSWALLVFEAEEGAKRFWEGGGVIKRGGKEEEFDYLTLEEVSWQGAKSWYYAYGGTFGPYVLLLQPGEEQAKKGKEEINYIFNRLIRP